MPDILATQRRLTEWFISEGPGTEIVLVPQVSVRTPGKGTARSDGTPRDPQSFKMIWTGGDGLQTGQSDGTSHKYDLILVGLYDCMAEVGDVWINGDQKYYIHSEYPFNNYERKFGLYSFGKSPSDV